MTGLLEDLMHDRADMLPAPAFDVDAIVRDGSRRVARRRTALVGASAAAVVVAALAVPGMVASPERRATDSLGASLGTGRPVWATGSTVHIGDASLDIGHRVLAFVETRSGMVLADTDGRVWAVDGRGTVEIGQTDAALPRLETDGERVAWIEETTGEAPVIALHDAASGETLRESRDDTPALPSRPDARPGAEVFAVDGDHVYFRDARGPVQWNVPLGTHTMLDLDPRVRIDDVRAGVMAYPAPVGRDTEGPVDYWLDDAIGSRGLARGRPLPTASGSVLSPGAAYLVGTNTDGRTTVYDVETGTATPAQPPGYDYVRGYAWVDDDTFLARGQSSDDDGTPIDLLRCDVGGGCAVAATAIGTVEDGLVLPIGEPTR